MGFVQPPTAGNHARERLDALGPTALSNVELLTVLIGSGGRYGSVEEIARRVVHDRPTLRDLAAAPSASLISIPGVGCATAARLAAACELGRRLQSERRRARPILASPEAVWRHLALTLRDCERERFLVLCLDSRNALIRTTMVSVGSVNASIVHPREVFKPALASSAAAIVVVHNHPSGDPAPSREDRDVTRVLSRAGRLLDVPLHDHVIVGCDSFFSFRDAHLI